MSRPDDRAPVERNSASRAGDRIVVLGRIAGTFGVKGWLKVSSYTEPPGNILDYEVLQIGAATGWSEIRITEGRETGKGVIAKFAGIDTPELGRLRVGAELGVWRSELPAPAPGEYYWSDLEGLQALNADGAELGRVDHFRTTPTGTVMVVKGAKELWVPFVKERLVKVEIDAGRIVLDWPLDW